jgi:hypothetical protein
MTNEQVCDHDNSLGTTACKGRSIRMDKLDILVVEHLAERLLRPERLAEVLHSLASRRAEKTAAIDRRIAGLEKEARDAEDRLAGFERSEDIVEHGLGLRRCRDGQNDVLVAFDQIKIEKRAALLLLAHKLLHIGYRVGAVRKKQRVPLPGRLHQCAVIQGGNPLQSVGIGLTHERAGDGWRCGGRYWHGHYSHLGHSQLEQAYTLK